MEPTINTFPVFEANQVLTNRHLNMVVDYLDQQERLTRANLVGIGIVCGLELSVNAASSTLLFTRGCAVTSQGYLIVESDDVTLTCYREYTLPEGDSYAPFMNGASQLPMWELFPDGEPNTTLLSSPTGFLTGKSVVLFVELNGEDLSDCSPNNCDDKGSEVTVTIRRLLMRNTDIATMMALLQSATDQSPILALPDIKLLKYDVPRTSLITSQQVLDAFQAVVKKPALVTAMQQALNDCFTAFAPIVGDVYPNNPFLGFTSTYGFLESLPVTEAQARFLQYYMDLFADLIAAYDELRDKGHEALCFCVPSDDYFPRHVVLGPQSCTGWYPSPASCCDCEALRKTVVMLFRRLVELTTTFTNNPALPNSSRFQKTDSQIRITPSRIGNVPLSAKAIPYYYKFDGATPLYRLWNQELTDRWRANHNMAYRSFEYQPPAPGFVRNALEHDLEAFNFLRIEGHIGKDYRRAIRTITSIRNANRLSFDVVALRTGELSEDVAVNLSKYTCHFNDLEAMYDALRLELMCLAKKSLSTFGRRPYKRGSAIAAAAFDSGSTSSNRSESMPAKSWFEEMTKELFSEPETMGTFFVERVRSNGFNDVNVPGEPTAVVTTLSAMVALVRFTANLADDLHTIDWDEFEDTYRRLKKLSEDVGRASTAGAEEDLTLKELNQQLVSVVYACRIEGFISIRDEYMRRLLEIKRLQFLSEYVKEHPDVQHKAGVPVGGTFILVYHDDSGDEVDEDETPRRKLSLAQQLFGNVEFKQSRSATVRSKLFRAAAARGSGGAIERAREALRRADLLDAQSNAFERLFDDMPNGTVIADFYLPYRCCSDCPPIQFVISDTPEPLSQSPTLTAQLGCTTTTGLAEVTLTVDGGKEPILLSIDGAAGIPLPTSTQLSTGSHTLQVTDADGLRSAPISVFVPQALQATTPVFTDNQGSATYTATFAISGGTAPYTVSSGTVSGSSISVGPIDSGNTVTVVVSDASRCTTSVTLVHNVEPLCDKPCDGNALRCRFPAWAPRPVKNIPYSYESVKNFEVQIADADGSRLFDQDLGSQVQQIVSRQTAITDATYDVVMDAVCEQINSIIAEKLGTDFFEVSYDATNGGTIVIERYVCHEFAIKLDFSITAGNAKHAESWEYSPKGAHVRQRSPGKGNYRVPPFGCIDRNKCLGTTGTDCKVSVRGIKPVQGPNGAQLVAELDSGVDPNSLRYFWRLDTPGLVFANTPEVSVPAGIKALRVQLLVIDSQGCWFFGEAVFTPDRTTPVRFIARPR